MNRHCGGFFFRTADGGPLYYRCLLDATMVADAEHLFYSLDSEGRCPNCDRVVKPWFEGIIPRLETRTMVKLPHPMEGWEELPR